jgi:hypothetical protein
MSASISLPDSDALRQHSYGKAIHSASRLFAWNAINRIVHHHMLTPIIFAQPDFYRSGNSTMPGYLIADVKVKSDLGISFINVAGFAVAATNELGELALKPQKVFH